MVSATATAASGSRKYAANPADIPDGTLVELFLSGIDQYHLPNAQMYPSAGGWKPVSHADVLDRVRSLAAALTSAGIQRGDRVGLLSENRPEWALTDYTLLSIGALTVPLYGTLPPGQI